LPQIKASNTRKKIKGETLKAKDKIAETAADITNQVANLQTI
jgi:hypothetical protein